jgi:hypothetical protein
LISFFSFGDKESVIESGKGIFKGESEIPIFEDNFNREEIGEENWQAEDELGIWQIENGELVGQGNGKVVWINLRRRFEADELIISFDAGIESKDWKPMTEIGVCVSDGSNEYYPQLIFDGEAHICPGSENNPFDPFSTPLKSNKVYRITAKRIERGKNVHLSLIVTDENGRRIGKPAFKTIENKGPERIKIGFVSFNFREVSYENNNDKIHIDNLKIYAYTT